jgi:hypothetical protein
MADFKVRQARLAQLVRRVLLVRLVQLAQQVQQVASLAQLVRLVRLVRLVQREPQVRREHLIFLAMSRLDLQQTATCLSGTAPHGLTQPQLKAL